MDAEYPARAAGSLLQVSLESGTGEVANVLFSEAEPTKIVTFLAGLCCSDFLAFATALCSFFLCRALLLPILVPEKDDMKKENNSQNFRQEDEDDGAATETENTSESKEAGHSRGQPLKAPTSLCGRNDDEPVVEDETKDSFGCTQLHLAAHAGDATEVDNLLDQGFNIHARENFGDTALHLAVRGGCAETTQTLLARKANPHVRNIFGTTPLSIAASFKDKTLLNLLQGKDTKA